MATDKAANINGHDFFVGGGEIGVYSQPEIKGRIKKEGNWTVDELIDIMPKKVTGGLVNPAPPQPPKA